MGDAEHEVHKGKDMLIQRKKNIDVQTRKQLAQILRGEKILVTQTKIQTLYSGIR